MSTELGCISCGYCDFYWDYCGTAHFLCRKEIDTINWIYANPLSNKTQDFKGTQKDMELIKEFIMFGVTCKYHTERKKP